MAHELPVSVVFGDWHGNGGFATKTLGRICREIPHASLYHLGDFGLYTSSYGVNYLDWVHAVLANHDTTLSVIPGNHEQWPLLTLDDPTSGLELTHLDADGFMISRRWPRIRVSPRTNLWTDGGRQFAALSGANSIDFFLSTEGKNWWREESPLPAHVEDLVTAADGRPIDVLLTHDAPSSAIDALNLYPQDRNRADWPADALTYARQSSDVMEQARARLMPTLHCCGHHHVRRSASIDGTQVEIMHCDQSRSIDRNTAVLEGTAVWTFAEYLQAHGGPL